MLKQVPPTPEEMQEKIELLEKANQVSYLMAVVCEKLGLVPYKTTHTELLNAFSTLMQQKIAIEGELQATFIATNNGQKIRKKRESKIRPGLQIVNADKQTERDLKGYIGGDEYGSGQFEHLRE